MINICIIPAKTNSSRVPGKNIRDFVGVPMLKRSIETAEKSGLFSQIIVSTDHQGVADLAMGWGADFLIRPKHLAEGNGAEDVGTQEVARHAIITTGWKGEYACCLYPCTPLLFPSDLQVAMANMLHRHDPKFVWADGMFYLGATKLFLDRVPLQGYRMESKRYIDINTESDWRQAEEMYREIHGIQDDIDTTRRTAL